MEQDVALRRLHAVEADLRASGIRALYLFGSTARREARDDSDVDLMFEVDPDARFSLIDQARLQLDLEAVLGRSVDFVESRGMHRIVREHAEADFVRVF